MNMKALFVKKKASLRYKLQESSRVARLDRRKQEQIFRSVFCMQKAWTQKARLLEES